MPTLTISEFSGQATNERGGLSPVAMLPTLGSQAVTFAATSVQSATLQTTTTLVRIATDANCRILTGVNPTALAGSSLPLAAGQSEYFAVAPGGTLKIAVIASA